LILVGVTLLASIAIHWFVLSGPFIRLAFRVSHHDLAHTPVWDGWFLYFWFPNQMPIFALGVLAYFAKEPVILLAAIHRKALLLVAVVICMLAFALLLFTSDRLWFLPHNFIAGIMFLCLILLLCAGFRARLLVNRLTAFLGMISFSIYITHFPVRDGINYLIHRYMPNAAKMPPMLYFPLFMITLLLAASAVAYVTYNLIEVPGIALGRKLVYRLRPTEGSRAVKSNIAVTP
jgi:peptidoglycan/LPS O-acetylase OafA/YrhL